MNESYTIKQEKEAVELVNERINSTKPASEGLMYSIYDLLAIQINELQKLNYSMESIYNLISNK